MAYRSYGYACCDDRLEWLKFPTNLETVLNVARLVFAVELHASELLKLNVGCEGGLFVRKVEGMLGLLLSSRFLRSKVMHNAVTSGGYTYH
jgi:hypothetical protein